MATIEGWVKHFKTVPDYTLISVRDALLVIESEPMIRNEYKDLGLPSLRILVDEEIERRKKII